MYCGTVERVMTARMTNIADGCSCCGIAVQCKLDCTSPPVKWHLEERHVPKPLVRFKLLRRVPNTDGYGGGLFRDSQH